MSAAPLPLPRREDQPDGSVKILFATPILDIGEPKKELTLRAPQAGEIWDIGDPRSFIYNDDGLGTPYVDRVRLRTWIGRLMVGHDVDIIGLQGDAALGLLIEEAVLDFFWESAEAIETCIRALADRGIAPSEIERMPLPRLRRWAKLYR